MTGERIVLDLVKLHGAVTPLEAGRTLHPSAAVREGIGASTSAGRAEQRLAAGLEVCEHLRESGRLERTQLKVNNEPWRIVYHLPGADLEAIQ